MSPGARRRELPPAALQPLAACARFVRSQPADFRSARFGTRPASYPPAIELALRIWEEDTRIGDRVRFLPASVFLPDPQPSDPLNTEPADELEIAGTILAFSDSGPLPRFFAVVATVQLGTVVVPVEKLRLEPDEEPDRKEPA